MTSVRKHWNFRSNLSKEWNSRTFLACVALLGTGPVCLAHLFDEHVRCTLGRSSAIQGHVLWCLGIFSFSNTLWHKVHISLFYFILFFLFILFFRSRKVYWRKGMGTRHSSWETGEHSLILWYYELDAIILNEWTLPKWRSNLKYFCKNIAVCCVIVSCLTLCHHVEIGTAQTTVPLVSWLSCMVCKPESQEEGP